ncbi:3-deoxy-manno-octulosonate-8-phosphatase KdsC [Dongshaea marina]|uniref:3-deoxy-manno-octulosonate-8-phosphatase KdsC n=1 Tax=Dongshaea marina TaxID=2047966 RepID=UPI000D3ECC77|nr:3-deoxy-manno-octulosonate-8-phosphatase KdsC [Dongshaea marina]
MTMVNTIYGPVPQQVIDKAQPIKLLICDVDGVLSDGSIYLGNQGEEFKAFNVKDGFGMQALRNAGVEIAIITGRSSQIVSDRMASLGITQVWQGVKDKLERFEYLLNELELSAREVAYIGDDLVDLPVMEQCGLSVAVADAHPLLQPKADWITQTDGGRGAVRELSDLLLFAQGKLEQATGLSL